MKRMFRCDFCGIVVPPRTRCQRIVVETRPKVYPFRDKAFRVVEWSKGGRHETWKDDPGGRGYETVREGKACPSCAASTLTCGH